MSVITSCRICGASNLQPVIDLGSTPLANRLLTTEDLGGPEPMYPLKLVFCEACTLLQITETVSPEELFSHYLYLSSFSETMLHHAKLLAQQLTSQRKLSSESLVIEVASNDGYLLQNYKQANIPVLGIEPARNIADIARQKGIRTFCRFFGSDTAEDLRLQEMKADVLHAHNVLAHVADQNDFVEGIRLLLKDDGIAIIEVPYAIDMIDQGEFDQIYHEHLCYFSLTALKQLFAQHHLTIVDVEHIAMHGGSLRISVQHAHGAQARDSVHAFLEREQRWNVNAMEPYRAFAARTIAWKVSLMTLLQQLKKDGCSIAAYGASAKGCTLLHYCGIGGETLDYVVDRSTFKQGRFTPGTHLPIHSPEMLLHTRPQYVLLLTWNFSEEILRQQEAYLEQGGAFIVPFPEPRIIPSIHASSPLHTEQHVSSHNKRAREESVVDIARSARDPH